MTFRLGMDSSDYTRVFLMQLERDVEKWKAIINYPVICSRCQGESQDFPYLYKW